MGNNTDTTGKYRLCKWKQTLFGTGMVYIQEFEDYNEADFWRKALDKECEPPRTWTTLDFIGDLP